MDNVQQLVPFLAVSDMQKSLRFYVDGLGFQVRNKWEPQGELRWCWLALGTTAVMLQTGRAAGPGGISLFFICNDAIAIYRTLLAKGLSPREPQVGNGMWETSLLDPDGYRVHFESVTDVPEEMTLSEWENPAS